MALLHFAFNGNPRKGKKKRNAGRRKKKKSVARRSKRTKTKSKAASKSLKRTSMAKRRKSRKGKKRNPVFTVKKGGKVAYRSPNISSPKKSKQLEESYLRAKRHYDAAPDASAEKKRYRKALAKIQSKLMKEHDVKRVLAKYSEEGADIRASKEKGAKVAKRKKRKSKKSRKVKAKKARRVKRKKHAKKAKAPKRAKRSKRRKHSKRRRAKKVKHAKVAAPKKARRRKKRKYPKMKTHRHARSMRHLKKGATGRVSMTFGKGRKKVKFTGRVKANPQRRNPMSAALDKVKKGAKVLDVSQLISLGAGGALVPIANSLASKFAPKVVDFINSYAGPAATGSLVPGLIGVLASVAAEFAPAGKAKDGLKIVGEGLAAASVISLASSLSSQYVAPKILGMAGINYTPRMGIMPTMGDIRYTPRNMSGINYTPRMSGPVPQMGIMPQMGAADYGGTGGYTEDHKLSRSDFGRDADFGDIRNTMDDDSDEIGTEDDIGDGSMSGSMG